MRLWNPHTCLLNCVFSPPNSTVRSACPRTIFYLPFVITVNKFVTYEVINHQLKLSWRQFSQNSCLLRTPRAYIYLCYQNGLSSQGYFVYTFDCMLVKYVFLNYIYCVCMWICMYICVLFVFVCMFACVMC